MLEGLLQAAVWFDGYVSFDTRRPDFLLIFDYV